MITTTQETAIREWLAAHPTLAVGIGDEKAACSVAAINLALTGTLTDAVPACMSVVIGQWMIGVQDAMPDDIRSSAAWRDLLPLAAGTGRAHEAERMTMVLEWMWTVVLPTVQPLADDCGFGAAWLDMCQTRTVAAADAAAAAAYAAADARDAAVYAAAAYAGAAAAADAAADAAYAAADAAYAAAAYAAAYADADADAVAYADAAAAADAAYAAYGAYGDTGAAWHTFDPVGLLRQLIAVTDPRALEAR
jgi:hypothetical protein